MDLRFWGEVELVYMDLWGKIKYFQGAEDFFSWILGDQCIILREHRTPLGAS